jgi:hypothetical protein
MSGLLRRLTRRRPATADETGTPDPASSEPAGATAETPAEAGGDQPVATGDEQATQVLPATGEQTAVAGEQTEQTAVAGEQTVAIPVRDLPAGVDPTEYADAPPEASAPRGKLRRRLRYLRRVRELLLRDLGGFTFELHRTADDKPEESHRRLARAKIDRIAALDAEVRALEARLGEPHEGALLREPGIGGLCPECGELHASDAHYCARCGAPLDDKARARRDAAAQPATGSHAVAEPAPASVLWAAGPRPAVPTPATPEEEPQDAPSEVTSQWLTLPHEKKAEPEPPAAAAEEPKAEPEEPAAAAEPKTEPEAPAAAAEPKTEPEAPAAAAEPKTEPVGEDPTFEPAPNGRPTEDTEGDPLASRRDEST